MSPPASPPSLLDRLRRFDPTVLPIIVAALVLVGAVAWLLGRPLPQPVADNATAGQIAALRADLARLEGLGARVAALEGTAQRLAALEGRAPPDLAPLREAIGSAAGRAEAAARQAAALEERIAATARDLAARPVIDPNAVAPRPALDQLAGRVEALARESAAADAQAGQRQLAAEQALTGFAGRVAANESALAARTQAIETQNARIAAVEQALAARLVALEGQIAQRAQAAEQQAARLAALEAVAQRLAALEGRASRMAALDAVRTALEAGQPLGGALRPLGEAPQALARFATAAPPTEASLRLSFEDAARAGRAASEPPAGTGVLDSAVSRLSGMVTVRRGEEMLWGDAAGAAIERARRALEAGDLDGALGHLARLSPPAREAMRGWIGQAEALVAARAALRQLAAG
jgi:hypothetical protein